MLIGTNEGVAIVAVRLESLCWTASTLACMALQVTAQTLRSPAMDLLPNLLQFSNPEVRAAAVFALGAMIQAHAHPFAGPGPGAQRMASTERLQAERQIAEHLILAVDDASPLVRSEVAVAFGRVTCGHSDMFQARTLCLKARFPRTWLVSLSVVCYMTLALCFLCTSHASVERIVCTAPRDQQAMRLLFLLPFVD